MPPFYSRYHLFCNLYAWEHMETSTEQVRTFEKVGPCLYRYTATGTYYALVKVKEQRVRRSLDTIDRAVAKRVVIV